MLTIELISGFYCLGLIFSAGGSNPEILIDGTPVSQCEKAPDFSPIRVKSLWRNAQRGEKAGDIIVNFYSKKRNETCPVKDPAAPVPILNGSCTSDDSCRPIKFTKCSEKICKCLPGYVEALNQCFGKLGSKCSEDRECAPASSVCSLETCQCPITHYSKDGHCYEFATRLRFPAHSSEACQYLENSVYSSGSCQCAPEYDEDAGQCLKKVGASCSENFECARPSVCSSETCQCPITHYSKDGHCYEFATRLRFSAHSSEACQYLENSVHSSGSCQCAPEYDEDAGQCLKKVGAMCSENFECARPSVCSETCQCPETHFSKDGKCYRKLNSRCLSDEQCKVPFSECSKGVCKCKLKYIRHENKCYGTVDTTCNQPEDCALLFYDCQSGNCTNVLSEIEGKLISSKPGTTATWQPYLNQWGHPELLDHYLGEPSHVPGPEKVGNLAWVKNFTLDRLFSGVEWNRVDNPSWMKIYCRAKNSTGEFTSGLVYIPGDGKCKFNENGIKHSTDDWAVLVDLGPIK